MNIEIMQLAGRDGDTAYNLRRALEAIAHCDADTDLLVFPETHLMGFVAGDRLATVAETLEGPTLQAVQQAVRERGVSVVIGLVENDAGVFYNTSVLVQAARADYHYLNDRRLTLPGETVEHADGRRELLIR